MPGEWLGGVGLGVVPAPDASCERMRLHGTQHSAVNQTLPRNIWNVLCLNALRCHPLLPTQMLTYTSNVLELGGPGAGLVLAAWPALRLLAPELQDPVLSGPLYQAVAAFDDMTQVSRMRGAGRPGVITQPVM